jgi:hypothetical protein
MKTIKSKRIPISFRKELYEAKLNDFNTRMNLQKLIKNELKKLLGSDPIDIECSEALKSFYLNLERVKAEVNSLGLKGNRLADLLGIDLSNLKDLEREYKKVQLCEVPSVEAFTTYAETEGELAKYDACQLLIKAFEVAKTHLDQIGSFNPYKVKNALLPMLIYNEDLQKFEPSNVFIKNDL